MTWRPATILSPVEAPACHRGAAPVVLRPGCRVLARELAGGGVVALWHGAEVRVEGEAVGWVESNKGRDGAEEER